MEPEDADAQVFQWIGTANASADTSAASTKKAKMRIASPSRAMWTPECSINHATEQFPALSTTCAFAIQDTPGNCQEFRRAGTFQTSKRYCGCRRASKAACDASKVRGCRRWQHAKRKTRLAAGFSDRAVDALGDTHARATEYRFNRAANSISLRLPLASASRYHCCIA